MTVERIMLGGKRIFIVGPPTSDPPIPSDADGRRPSGSLRALLAGVPIHRDEARAVSLGLDEIEMQAKSILHDLVLVVTSVEVVLAEARDARARLPR